MNILHTSDWHLGHSLYGCKRYKEFETFLKWLIDTVNEKQIEVLLIAGDIFDTSTPSNRAQELYYRFLCQVANSSCRHVVVIAGNHDSPTFLNAPKELLRALDVHIIGSVDNNLENEVLVLKNQKNDPELIVCAIPYLRDKDIRTAGAGESIEDKEQKLLEGIRARYAQTCALAVQKRAELNKELPIVAMGHLFAAGGKTVEGDGVRELYVGSLAHVPATIFPQCIDYLALGHLHVPQMLNNLAHMRYSGSPLPMGFGEANQQKSICLVQFTGIIPRINLIKVPVFQPLVRIKGNWEAIQAQISALSTVRSQAWLEIIYEGEAIIGDLRELLEEALLDTKMVLLRVKNNRIMDRIINRMHCTETLDDLNVKEVFERCLAVHKIAPNDWPDLLATYQETLKFLDEKDLMAE